LPELLALSVDLLVTTGTSATTAAKRATDAIPIVFESVGAYFGDFDRLFRSKVNASFGAK
jgi:hypothetical protein